MCIRSFEKSVIWHHSFDMNALLIYLDRLVLGLELFDFSKSRIIMDVYMITKMSLGVHILFIFRDELNNFSTL